MKIETIKRVRYYIENLDQLSDHRISMYLLIAKVFDSPKAVDLLHDFMQTSYQKIFEDYCYDYFIINTYLKLNNKKTITNFKEVEQYKEEHLEEITNAIKYNCLKNSMVSVHSFNGVLKDVIYQQGLKIDRKDNADILKMHMLLEFMFPYSMSFVISNSDTKKISTASIPQSDYLTYANASPEWLEQFLHSNFDVEYEEYAKKDLTIIKKKVKEKFELLEKRLDNGELKISSKKLEEIKEYQSICGTKSPFEEVNKRINAGCLEISKEEFKTLKQLTNKYINLYVTKKNPCFAIINQELNTEEVEDLAKIEMSYYELIKMHSGFQYEKDIKPELLHIIELPVFSKVLSQNDTIQNKTILD